MMLKLSTLPQKKGKKTFAEIFAGPVPTAFQYKEPPELKNVKKETYKAQTVMPSTNETLNEIHASIALTAPRLYQHYGMPVPAYIRDGWFIHSSKDQQDAQNKDTKVKGNKKGKGKQS
ncbi:OLC1v1017771C1 [Oldenlandia corymbosa var. corymbosa]|uniref:OLC1v1017771C1 n=1 Tax=Oldenlandia corymbosa var. corymbosa TaxID=529605 RepID=A0AAV1EA67_OLDCO|nr:OLC1v1017771C1 [Oldenlandia corymbosa var. corymbosa]